MDKYDKYSIEDEERTPLKEKKIVNKVASSSPAQAQTPTKLDQTDVINDGEEQSRDQYDTIKDEIEFPLKEKVIETRDAASGPSQPQISKLAIQFDEYSIEDEESVYLKEEAIKKKLSHVPAQVKNPEKIIPDIPSDEYTIEDEEAIYLKEKSKLKVLKVKSKEKMKKAHPSKEKFPEKTIPSEEYSIEDEEAVFLKEKSKLKVVEPSRPTGAVKNTEKTIAVIPSSEYTIEDEEAVFLKEKSQSKVVVKPSHPTEPVKVPEKPIVDVPSDEYTIKKEEAVFIKEKSKSKISAPTYPADTNKTPIKPEKTGPSPKPVTAGACPGFGGKLPGIPSDEYSIEDEEVVFLKEENRKANKLVSSRTAEAQTIKQRPVKKEARKDPS